MTLLRALKCPANRPPITPFKFKLKGCDETINQINQLNGKQNTTEPIDHTEHVVVDGINTNRARTPINGRSGIGLVQKLIHRNLPVDRVNATRIQGTGGLGIFGPQGEGVRVDVVLDRGCRVMLVWLHEAEIGRIP